MVSQEVKDKLAGLGLGLPSILLPKEGTDYSKWAVIACDQYTSEPEYWETVAAQVGDADSTYKIILPEVFLEKPEEEAVIESVKKTMKEYTESGVFVPQNPGFLLLDRKTHVMPSRKGLMVALDLEHYSYEKGSKTFMRATEGTILARLPPRVRVREAASVELPHIMVLIDDPDRTVVEPLFAKKDSLKCAYDFDLMCNGGHLKGWSVDGADDIAQIADAVSKLADPEVYAKKYDIPVPSKNELLLYAMGDGNHSFATGKLHWEKTKKAAQEKGESLDDLMATHPARYALVEIVNIHDEGLEFEGIHRVLFNVAEGSFFEKMKAWFAAKGSEVTTETLGDLKEAARIFEKTTPAAAKIGYVTPAGCGVITISQPSKSLETAVLQEFLDEYLAENKDTKIDYVHGVDSTSTLGAKAGNMGFFCPDISKTTFFRTIILDGAYPRKTFSMGEADEKRFYVECRAIVP